MRNKRHILRVPRNIDIDLSGACIQAFEKHRSTRLSSMRYSKICDTFRDNLLLRRVSHFCSRKMIHRNTPSRLGRFASVIWRKYRGKIRHLLLQDINGFSCSSTLTDASTVSGDFANSLACGLRTPLRTARVQSNVFVRGTLTPSPSICPPVSCEYMATRKPVPRHRSTLCHLESPACSKISGKCFSPPFTPRSQIIRTPTYPPEMERYDARKTPFRQQCDFAPGNLSPTEFGRPDLPELDSSTVLCYKFNLRASGYRDRSFIRRLSYSQPRTESPPLPLSSPLKMANLANAVSGRHGLASPLTIRSLNSATPCTRQVRKDNGPTYLQWRSHHHGYFA